MCRFLAIRSARPLDISPYLSAFATLCRGSREYQGHGWGCAWMVDGSWQVHRSLTPVWEDSFHPSAPVRVFVAHARSAFRDEGIRVENNMPFLADDQAFVFNGELHGVRLSVDGRIGAEKVMNLIRRFPRTRTVDAIRAGVRLLNRRTDSVRAMNFVLAEPDRFHVHCAFTESPDYYTVRVHRSDSRTVICSEPLPSVNLSWVPMQNGALEVFT